MLDVNLIKLKNLFSFVLVFKRRDTHPKHASTDRDGLCDDITQGLVIDDNSKRSYAKDMFDLVTVN